MFAATGRPPQIDAELSEESYSRCRLLGEHSPCDGKLVAIVVTTHLSAMPNTMDRRVSRAQSTAFATRQLRRVASAAQEGCATDTRSARLIAECVQCLVYDSRGLAAFVQYKSFDRLFEVLLSPVYLQAMRRRRSSDPMGDTASNLGNAMDELMRHQPSLKTEATKAIIRLLEELVKLGTGTLLKHISEKQIQLFRVNNCTEGK